MTAVDSYGSLPENLTRLLPLFARKLSYGL